MTKFRSAIANRSLVDLAAMRSMLHQACLDAGEQYGSLPVVGEYQRVVHAAFSADRWAEIAEEGRISIDPRKDVE